MNERAAGGPRAAGAVRAGYPEPVFALRGAASPAPAPSAGNAHLKLTLGRGIDAIGFGMGTGSARARLGRGGVHAGVRRGTVRAGCSSSSATSVHRARGGGPPRRLTAGYATPQLALRSVKRVPSFASLFTWIRSACFSARATPA